jgi:hypothetical protein
MPLNGLDTDMVIQTPDSYGLIGNGRSQEFTIMCNLEASEPSDWFLMHKMINHCSGRFISLFISPLIWIIKIILLQYDLVNS